jgi:hypothetical protein
LNTGILGDGLRLVDIDIDDGEFAEKAAYLAFRILGEAPVRYRRNSPRRCIAYRAATGEPRKRIIVGQHGKVEILGRGQQALAFGRHPSGAELEWTTAPGQIMRDDLPAVSEDQIAELLIALAPLIGATPSQANGGGGRGHAPSEPQADIDRIAAAIAVIPNDGPPGWEMWNRIGMALWAATGGSVDGRKVWREWSSKHPSYDAAATEERWKHYLSSPPSALGAGTIFYAAQEAERERMAGWFDAGPAAGPERQPGADPWANLTQPQAQPGPESQPEACETGKDDWPEPMGDSGVSRPVRRCSRGDHAAHRGRSAWPAAPAPHILRQQDRPGTALPSRRRAARDQPLRAASRRHIPRSKGHGGVRDPCTVRDRPA